MSEHLSTCPECRREESEYRSLFAAAEQVKARTVSADFTTKLFHRLAEERFAETRTKAYLPKRAPVVRWAAVAPVAVSVCVLTLVGIMMLSGGQEPQTAMADLGGDPSTRYMTAQPTHNPNLTVNLEKDWSLAAQMARAERLNRLSQAVGAQVEFHGLPTYGATNVAATTGASPYVSEVYRIRPVIRSYQTPDGTAREVDQTY
ncbi:MAG TPA: hypothetical protein PKW75_07535 [candidate division Zixibacteria bacterium]|nr:hypothetical protein [candidate division Zixibacteria bacterium]MDM7973076.1 hypothetical protein [candidate division Zixibacteria bacterium]HOD66806.1 hypothetical protein [candidate division Zixibacteria bacterium]HOZ08123.1 hypothetical protein [candidate division Zixibacteria bacterium]HPM36368.1 hypothetical protein [candidate division Zixibacteria bacterium]